jgi:hypothetical protein
MGIALPQVVTSDRASGAQVIDGSLKFDASKSQYLTRTPGSAGNRKTWTWSCWLRRDNLGSNRTLFSVDNTENFIRFQSDAFHFYDQSQNKLTSTLFRDSSGWYNLVLAVDYTASAADMVKGYINGSLVTWGSVDNTFSDTNGGFNDTTAHEIGRDADGDNDPFDGRMSQVYFIDGQALGPGYFGYTDGLTNTWRPKKFSGNYTTAASGVVYSDYGSGTVNGPRTYDKAFDGSTSTFCEPSDNQTVTFDFTSLPGGGITVSSSLRMYLNKAGTPAASHFTVNGTNLGGSVPSNDWLTINSVSLLETITFYHQSGSSSVELYAVEVDGSILTDGTAAQGANSFYLPMDGNSPIGEDKSGNGNNWTPVNFGGSVALDNPQVSGARPILNTDGGGKTARPGVFGSEVSKYYTVTTANGSVYQFDITSGDNPSLSFIRGATYKFDYSSFTGHPLLFSSTNPDSSTTAYTDGTSIASNVISFTVPHDAPDTLYYYCQNHPTSMNGAISITTDTKKADPYAWKNVLALPLVGSANDVSNSVNSGSSTKAITVTNAVASSAASNFYGGSWYFDGTDDGIAVTNTSQLDFGSDDFTIEMWFYDTVGDSSSDTLIATSEYNSSSSNNGFAVYSLGKGIRMFDRTGGSFVKRTSDGQVFETNTWNHFAWTRTGSENKMYVNGNLTQSWSNSITYSAGQRIFIGANDYTGSGGSPDEYEFNGYIQDIRIYKGLAKYTSDFVVPSTSPDILPDTPSGVSGGSALTKITDGAVSFDGASDYLNLGSSADYNVGTGDFTFECFAYYNTRNNYSGIFGAYTYSTNAILIQISNSSVLRLVNPGGIDVSGTTNISNRWVHIAVTRSGTTLRGFINGIQEISTTYSSSIDFANGGAAVLGVTDVSTYLGTYDFRGFISNAHFVKGTALYTANFTPPTRTLTNVTNTKLLCCQSPSNVKLSPVAPNVGTTSNTRFNSNFESIPTTVNGLTVTNNGSVSTTSAGTNSYGFTNCADLSGSNSLSVDLGAIPQVTTIDIIFKVTGTTDNKYLFAISNTGIVRRTGSSLAWYNNNADQTISTTPDDGKWHHLRVTPNTLYFDGVSIQRTTSTPNIFESSNGYMALGAYRNDSGTIQYNGGVDIGLVRVMPGVDLGSPSSIPITTNGTLSSTETIPPDGVIFAAGNTSATNFNPFTTDINAVRGQETGYCTLNPLDATLTSISDGNLNSGTSGAAS